MIEPDARGGVGRFSRWGATPVTLRSEAARILVTSEAGLTAEAALGPDKEIRLVLR